MFKVEVLIEHPVQALDRGFSYLSKKPILTGIRVQVPLIIDRLLVMYYL